MILTLISVLRERRSVRSKVVAGKLKGLRLLGCEEGKGSVEGEGVK